MSVISPTRSRLILIAVCGAVVVVALCFVVVIFMFVRHPMGSYTAETTDPEPAQAEKNKTLQTAVSDEDESIDDAGDPIDAFSPSNVIGNPDCKLHFGAELAAEYAVLVVPSKAGSEFAVLNHEGIFHQDELPFEVDQVDIGLRSDGTPLLGLGDTRHLPQFDDDSDLIEMMNDPENRFRDIHNPLRIYYGSDIVYETDGAWQFSVAKDGSSYAIHEPASGGASRLVVRNIDVGTESHFNLPPALSARSRFGRNPGYRLRYSGDSSELIFDWGRGPPVKYFVGVNDGETRKQYFESNDRVFSQSSEIAYIARVSPLERLRGLSREFPLTKRRYDHVSGSHVDEWVRNLNLEGTFPHFLVSANGKWIAFSGKRKFIVIHESTGDVAIKLDVWPFRKPNEQEMARNFVREPRPDARESIGLAMYFAGDHFVARRSYMHYDSCNVIGESKLSEYDYLDCISENQDEREPQVSLDIFDLSNLREDGLPSQTVHYTKDDYREDSAFSTNCVLRKPPLRGLENVDGTLVYIPH